MKIKDIENKIQNHIETLRELRDTLTELYDNVADGDIDGKQIFCNQLKWANENIMNAINSLEHVEGEYKEFLDRKEEREAMEKFTSFRPW